MKIKLVMIGLFGLISATAFAQKGELNNAETSYSEYTVSAGSKVALLITKANKALDDAKTAIDKASANEKTSALPHTYALKGAIYAALAVRDTVPATSAPLIETAGDAIKKAKELDTKSENKKLIDDANRYVAQYNLNAGIKAYQGHKYDVAYKSFDNYRQIFPEDTNAVYYTALSAANQGSVDPKYYPLANTNYSKLLTLKYSGNAKVYTDMAIIYLNSKDTVNALKIIGEAVAKYPANTEFRKREIEISLQSGKVNDVLVKIQNAVTNDPKNKTLYYYEGLTYTQLADAANIKWDKAKDDATKNAQLQIALDNYTKAAEQYKKAIEIDANYFDANLNLGYVLIKPAIDTYNEAIKLPGSKQKEYDAALLKADAQFDMAKPYLQKAVDLNPRSVDALTNLRNYYRGKSDKTQKADNKAKADELKKQIDALTTSGN